MTGPVPLPTQFYALIQPVSTPTLPTVSAVSPSALTVGTEDSVLITGTGFATGCIVAAEFCSCGVPEILSATQIRVPIIANRVGTHDLRVITSDGYGGTLADAFTVSAKALFDETFSTARSAPLGNSITQYTADVKGFWRVKFSVNSTVSGGALNLLSTDASFKFTDIEQRIRKAGRLHYVRMTTRTGAGQDSRQLALCNDIPSDVSNWETGSGEYGFQSKTGATSAEDGRYLKDGTSKGTFFRKLFWVESTTFEIAILEREGVGAVMLWKNGASWQILHMADFGSKPCRLLVSQGTAAHGVYDRIATYETGWTLDPIVSDSFVRADGSVGASDGDGQTEKGGSGVTPTITGSAAIASNYLTASSGTITALWESSQTEQWVTAKCTPVDGSAVGVICRAVDDANYWLAEIDSSADKIELIEVSSGTRTVRVTSSLSGDPTPGTIDSGTEYTVQICSIGTEIRAWVEGTISTHNPFVTYTSSTHQTATKAGVRIVSGAMARDFGVFSSLQSLPTI